MEPDLTKEILEKIISYTERKWEERSHTYLPEYRASRQSYKDIRDYASRLAKANNINIEIKELSCKYN